MKTLFIMDPWSKIAFDHDSTFALMCAGQRRGHTIHCCEPRHLSVDSQGDVNAQVQEVQLQKGQPAPLTLKEERRPLGDFTVTWMRFDPPVNEAYLYSALLLSQAAQAGCHIINRPDSLILANEKLYPLRHFAEWMPKTLVTSQLSLLKQFVSEQGAVVLKPLNGFAGRGIFMLREGDSNLEPAYELLTGQGAHPLMAQAFIPQVSQGDKRIIVAGGKAIGAINRVPTGHRANMAVGGIAEASTLSEKEQQMCAAIAPRLLMDGLFLVGIDVIGGYLTEVNVTSPTGLQEIEKLCGIDASDLVWSALEAQLK